LVQTAAIATAGPLVHFAIGVDRQCFQPIVAAPIAHETNYIRLNLITLQAGLAGKAKHDLGSLAYALKIGFQVAVAVTTASSSSSHSQNYRTS
jgi:hypothetical protein